MKIRQVPDRFPDMPDMPASASDTYRTLRHDYAWSVTVGDQTFSGTIHCGFISDGCSIPLWMQWLCGSRFSEPRIVAALVHDWLYAAQLTSRETADEIYRAIEAEVGICAYKRAVEYRNLRWFGGSAYDGHGLADQLAARKLGTLSVTPVTK